MGLLSFCIDCLFPPHCVSCKAGGEWWCTACRGSLEYVRRNICPSCASVAKEHECPQSKPLDGLVAAGFYHARPLREMLRALKYHGVTRVTPSVAPFVRSWKDARCEVWPWTGVSSLAIQYLPAASNRVRERGFDQAKIFSEIIRQEIVPWATPVDLLVRSSSSTAQAQLDHGSLRDVNVRDAFFTRPVRNIPPNILLVDDVVTTGSTMREAARILRRAGAQKVYGLALAVGA